MNETLMFFKLVLLELTSHNQGFISSVETPLKHFDMMGKIVMVLFQYFHFLPFKYIFSLGSNKKSQGLWSIKGIVQDNLDKN